MVSFTRGLNVAADGALQHTICELRDRFTGFYNYRVRISAVKDYKSSFYFSYQPKKWFINFTKATFMVADFKDILLSSFCVAEGLLEEMKVSELSWLACKVSGSRNTNTLHVSNRASALKLAGTVKVTVTDTDITGGFCPKTCCHDSVARRKRRAKCSLRKHLHQTRLFLEPLSSPVRP